MTKPCEHATATADVTPRANGCEECLATGGEWIHLRMCMVCGHIGCCEDSPGRHATAHFHETGHPVMQSFEPGEDWWWCYVDEIGFTVPGSPTYSHT